MRPMNHPTLDEAAITRLVDHFYDKVRVDPLIGPVFNAAVHDWPEHKRLLTTFWCSVALGAASYRGNPMAMHRRLPIRAENFDQWLTLWRATCAKELDEAGATRMVEYAERIGRSLKYGLGLNPDARGIGVPLISVSR